MGASLLCRCLEGGFETVAQRNIKIIQRDGQTQIDQARVLHAKAAADLDDLRGQLEDQSLDPFERELIEEDVDHQTTDLARHMRRTDAWMPPTTHAGGSTSPETLQLACKCTSSRPIIPTTYHQFMVHKASLRPCSAC